MPNRHHGPPKRRLTMTWHAHNNHTPPLHAHPLLRHRDSAAPTGGFTTIDTPPRRVAGVSHPYGRNSPHTPTHNRQPCARATTQHPAHPAPRPYTTSPPQHSQTPPRHHPHQRGFYYHRRPTTACRRRVAALWSQFPPHNRQPCAQATTQHPAHPAPRPYTTSPPQHSQTPPRHHPRLSVNPGCAHTHTRTRCHPPHVQPPPQRRPRPPPNPSCKRVPSHGLVPHIMAFTCNN